MERDYTRHRKHHTGNLHLVKDLVLRGKMEIPQLLPFIGGIPTCLLPFNRAMTTKRQDCAVHFFLDDYQFERIWRQPEKYLPVLKRFQCSLSPDFSLFADMPLPLQIYNTYRNRLIGRWLQTEGVQVIPTVSWSDPRSFSFCFDGIAIGETVAISTIGTRKNGYARHLWERGATAMMEQLQPSTVLVYGQPVPFDFGSAEVRYYSNEITEKLHSYGRKRSV